MPYDLTGRTAVITGASQGLGLAIARACVSAGASVLICARDASTIAAAREELENLGAGGTRVFAEAADVANEDDVARVVDRAISAFGTIDILVNNAGIYGPLGTIEEIDWQAWVRAIETNLLGSVLFCP